MVFEDFSEQAGLQRQQFRLFSPSLWRILELRSLRSTDTERTRPTMKYSDYFDNWPLSGSSGEGTSVSRYDFLLCVSPV